jgi:hypothetical protein
MASRPLANVVVFSAENGVVRAHLPGGIAPIELGDVETVAYMMRDFLAHCELGKRLDASATHHNTQPPS